MGFRKDAIATIWSVEPKSDTMTIVRLSTNAKKKDGSFEQDFGDFVAFIGTAVAKKAANLKEKDRIKLGDVVTKNKYLKEKNATYYNFQCFGFEKLDNSQKPSQLPEKTNTIEDIVEGVIEESKLPY